MTDLKKGIIKIGEIELSPYTRREDFEKDFGVKPSYESSGNFDVNTNRTDLSYYIYELDKTTIDNVEFYLRVTYANDKILSVELMPKFDEIDEKYGDMRGYNVQRSVAYAKEVRTELDKWLKKHLGKPYSKTNDETTYAFKDVTISTTSKIKSEYDDGHMEVEGGQIDIRYESVVGMLYDETDNIAGVDIKGEK